MEHLLKAKGLLGMVMETDLSANAAAQRQNNEKKRHFLSWYLKYNPAVPDNKLSDTKRSVGYAKRTFLERHSCK